MTSILRFHDVSFHFGKEAVVDGVGFDVGEGEIVCLLGPSGCGKTTSLRLAAGMETPTTGEIWLGGDKVSTADMVVPPEKRGIGFLFQDFALFPHMSVLDNVMFGLRKMPKAEMRSVAQGLLERVGLDGFGTKYPHTLSGGEQQRAALARALAPQPRLVLMDEPFSNLDAELRDQMRDLTVALLRETSAAGLIVTHDAADALRMADRIAVQNEGRLLQIDRPEVLYDAPATIDVATLFGPVNFLPNSLRVAAKAVGRAATRLGVRPEAISLAASLSAQEPGLVFAGDIIACRRLGPGWLAHIKLEGGAIWEAILHQFLAPAHGAHKFFVCSERVMLFN